MFPLPMNERRVPRSGRKPRPARLRKHNAGNERRACAGRTNAAAPPRTPGCRTPCMRQRRVLRRTWISRVRYSSMTIPDACIETLRRDRGQARGFSVHPTCSEAVLPPPRRPAAGLGFIRPEARGRRTPPPGRPSPLPAAARPAIGFRRRVGRRHRSSPSRERIQLITSILCPRPRSPCGRASCG